MIAVGEAEVPVGRGFGDNEVLGGRVDYYRYGEVMQV